MIETIYVNNIKENHRFKTFWNWSVNELCEETSLTRYYDEDHLSLNEDTMKHILDEIIETQPDIVSKYKFYIILETPEMDDNKWNNYFGLWKSTRQNLKKTGARLDFLEGVISENVYKVENKTNTSSDTIKYSGILTFEWPFFLDLIPYLGTMLNRFSPYAGLIFAFKDDQQIDFDKLENEIVNESSYAKKINVLLNKNGIVFFPHGSEDFGGIYLDILKK